MDVNRTLDLSTFTTDTWAVQATQAVPSAAAVQRLVANDAPVRVTFRARVGIKPGDASVADDVTTCDARIVRILTDERGVEFTELMTSIVEGGSQATKLGRGMTESDLRNGDVFVVGFPVLTVGDGSAAGMSVYVSGASPYQ